MKLKFRTVFWVLAGVGVAVLLAMAFRPQPVAVDVADTFSGEFVVSVRDEGRTRVRDEFVVHAPVGGRLLRVERKPGARVHAGDTVARIVPSAPAFLDARAASEARAAIAAAEAALGAAQADLARAEADLELATTELERAEALRLDDLVAADAVDRARRNVRVAETARDAARENVRARRADLAAANARLVQPGDETDAGAVEVRAPISGAILRVVRESEGVIAAGQEILALGDPGDLEVVVEMLSTDAVEIEPGAEAIIDGFGRQGLDLEGRVRLVEPYGFTKVSALGVEEQRVNVILDFTGPSSEWSRLGHGYRVEAAVITSRADNAVQAPVAALFRSDGEWAVFRVVDDAAVLTPVEVGRDNGRNAEILAGIDAAVPVVLYPGERMADGVAVRRRD